MVNKHELWARKSWAHDVIHELSAGLKTKSPLTKLERNTTGQGLKNMTKIMYLKHTELLGRVIFKYEYLWHL